MDIKRIIILGGGTAGWLAANHLGKALEHRQDILISLVESPDIPIIGVGEGTVPAIRQSLKRFGISESEFIRRCDVTFKQSIKFVNWMDKTRHGEGNFYHHLFDMPSPLGEDLTQHWLSHSEQAYGDLVSPQHKVCEAGRAPKQITHSEYEGALGYAYHLNAAKFAKLLAENAIRRFNVEHIMANVLDVSLTDSGDIGSLQTDSCGSISADLYIDCSGFQSLLIDKTLKVPFVDKSHQLFADKAIAVQVPIAADASIPPYTLATAHQAGWIWDIALTNRRGVGFVYSSKYMDDDEALNKLSRYLGQDLSQYKYRVLPMKLGYRKEFLHKNCLSLGLAQGFLEPLEATSILLTDFAAGFIANRFPADRAALDLLGQQFNQVMTYAWERVVEFIKMHYYLSDREDSAFWRDNRAPSGLPSELANRLALWRNHVPIRQDFFSKFEVFDLENYLYVLYGMHYPTANAAPQPDQSQASQAQAQQIAKVAQHLVSELPDHRALLEKIAAYGLQRC